MKKHILSTLFLMPVLVFAKEEGTGPPTYENTGSVQPPSIGNFALEPSQQPGAFISFGQNVIDQGDVQLFVFADAILGKDNRNTNIVPSLLYGIRNDLSLFFSVPFSPGNKEKENHSSGMNDILAQLEYVIYTGSNLNAVNQATLVVNVTFPTGSSSKDPPTGYGANSFFLGGTFSHMRVDWYWFTSYGATITTTTSHGTKFGDQLLYQFGFGRNIPSSKEWIFAWMLEFDGIFAWKDEIKARKNHDSGGNVIYMTPSIMISSKRTFLQFGVGYPIVQHLFGHQLKKFVAIDFNFGVTF